MKSMNFVEVPNGIQDFSKAVPQSVINSNKVSYYQESPNSNQFLLFHHPSHTLYYGPKFGPTFRFNYSENPNSSKRRKS